MTVQSLTALTKLLDSNTELLNKYLKGCPDIIQRRLITAHKQECLLLYVDGLINLDILQRDVLKPLQAVNESFEDISFLGDILPAANISYQTDVQGVVDEVLGGKALILVNGIAKAMSVNIIQFEKRSIEEPATEKNIRGPHEGFNEILGTNISILRRKVKNSSLRFHTLTLGSETKQKLAVAYIEGIAKRELLDELIRKIEGIKLDGLLAIGYVEQIITDFPMSPFPQYQTTERPDKAVAGLLEGKFVILLDGTPITLIVPVSFFSFFQALDDFSTHWIFGSFLRITRIFAAILAIFLPAMYISVVSFHYYMVPLNLLIPLAESRIKVPFPPIIEALIMEVTLELLREASIRLPTYIGASLGVVGGLIVGQAAVDAGIVSTLMIIIVAITGVSTFLVPNYDMGLAIRFYRFIVMILASIFGIIGIIISAAFLLSHLIDLKSLGQPYLQPFMPLKLDDLKDTIVRFPFKALKKRPDIAQPVDKIRGRKK